MRMNRKLHVVQLVVEIIAAVALYLQMRILVFPGHPSLHRVKPSHHVPSRSPAPPAEDQSRCGKLWDVPTLYINLERAPGRRAEIEANLKNLRPVDMFRRLNASDGQDPETRELAQRVSGFLSLAETAVMLSHLRAIEYGMEQFSKSKYFLVLEDDISFSTVPRWAGTLGDLLDEATLEYPDWEILNVACSNWRDSSAFLAGYFFQPYKFKNLVRFKGPEFFGAVAYAVRRSPGLSNLVSDFKRWKELGAAKRKSLVWSNGTEETALLTRLFSEPSDWMLYRRLKSYLTTVPLLVPNNTELSSLVHEEKTMAHLVQAAISLSFWGTQKTVCHDVDSSNLATFDLAPSSASVQKNEQTKNNVGSRAASSGSLEAEANFR